MTNRPVCPLCRSHRNQERFAQNGYTLLVCDDCELLFIHPYPSTSDQVHARVADYSRHEIEIADPERHYLASVQFYKKYFPLVTRECEGARSVLDVGCGSGHLLERLRIHPHLHRVGIELNAERAEMARKVAGCDIHGVPVEKFSSDKKFDVIVLMNLFSHVPSLDRLFASLRSLVEPTGKVILKVGEMAKNVRRRDVVDWEIPDHLQFFGLSTARSICRQYNFRVVTHRRVPISEDLFSPEWWKAPGRSPYRNVVKQGIARVPFALPILARWYDFTRGGRVYSSFIVLSPESR